MDARRDMTVGAEWKELLLFSLPIMAGQLLQQLYNTVDSIVVSRYGGPTREICDAMFAAVGSCTSLIFLFLAISLGLANGGGRPRLAALRGAARDGAPARGLDSAHNPGRAGRLPRRRGLAGRAGAGRRPHARHRPGLPRVRDRVLRHLRRGPRLPVHIQRRRGHTSRRRRQQGEHVLPVRQRGAQHRARPLVRDKLRLGRRRRRGGDGARAGRVRGLQHLLYVPPLPDFPLPPGRIRLRYGQIPPLPQPRHPRDYPAGRRLAGQRPSSSAS